MSNIVKEPEKRSSIEQLRFAWLLPSMVRGNYWHPVFSQFTKLFGQTKVYTGLWPGFAAGFEDTFDVTIVGQTSFTSLSKPTEGYQTGFIKASPKIIIHLLQFKPQVIFTSGFSIWTLLIILLKIWGRWEIIIFYDGSSPNIDCQNSVVRLLYRRIIIKAIDAGITNSQAGKTYLTKIVGAKADSIFARPYQVPSTEALLREKSRDEPISVAKSTEKKPIFLFVGQLIPRKGLHLLLQACLLLQQQGTKNFTIQIIGDGAEGEQLATFANQHNLSDRIQWIGKVDYHQLWKYFQAADVFVFPTLEDIWGLVVLEAMFFGKPIICSKYAGASEMVTAGANGYIVDPLQPEELAKTMQAFIDSPELILQMGEQSKTLIEPHTPAAAVDLFTEAVEYAISQ